MPEDMPREQICARTFPEGIKCCFSIIIGLAQGSQPIESFNYGAKQYKRVKDAFLLAASVGAVVSIISFLLFQLFPRQILGLFGSGSEEYFEFGVNYFRAFLFFTWLNFLQPISSMFFSSIGKTVEDHRRGLAQP